MFVDQLSNNEKQALMYLLVDISKADGDLAESEVSFLSTYSSEHGVHLDLEKDVSISNACNAIESGKGKVVALQEIVKLAIVDGHYDDSERKGAIVISEMLNVDLAKFEEIEKWVLDGQQWVNQGFQMLDKA